MILMRDNVNPIDVVQDAGSTDYVLNGHIFKNAPVSPVLVGSSSDLDTLVDYEPGTIAYTAGFQDMWQKGLDGTWETILTLS